MAVGDVTGPRGIEHLKEKLWRVRKEHGVDFCVVNGENASFITGISPDGAEVLFRAGADVITGGNHTLRNKLIFTYLDDVREIIRPINFGDAAPGSGYTIVDACGYRMMVINAMGNVYIEPTLDSPFGYIERALAREEGRYDFAILDLHAEATGEKYAVAHAFDGRINVVFGTHTHVQTADEQVLPRGTGYITDLGMCGPDNSVLGIDTKCIVEKLRNHIPVKFTVTGTKVTAHGAIFTLDASSGKVKNVERITF